MILIVDDDEIIRKRLKKNLEIDGYQVSTAEDGRKCLELFNNIQPQIVVLDIKMPGMDGIEVLKRIKKENNSVETEVIMITGHGDVSSAIEAMKGGAFSYIQKPIESEELEIEVKKAFEKIQMKRALDQHVQQLEKRTSELEKAHKRLEFVYQQLNHDYEIASNIFAKMMRSDKIQCTNMKYLLSAMAIVAGDHVLCAPKPSGGMYTFFGDFTGHGLSAAIRAIPVADIFYAMVDKNFSICEIVAEINNKLKTTLPPLIYLAACLAEVNQESGTLTVWNGGIPDVLVVGKQGGIKNRLTSRHLPLGVVGNDNLDLDVEIFEVSENDRIYICSDGVTETYNPKKEMFGQHRLEELLQKDYEPEGILDKIRNELETFRGSAPQQDDITIVEITCAPWSVRCLDDEVTLREKALYSGWNFSLKFDAETLRTVDVPSFFINMIEEDPKLKEHKVNIFLIIQELVSNSLEHGLLKLPSDLKKNIEGFEQYASLRQETLNALRKGWIKVDLEFVPVEKGGKLFVRVDDTGPGFNYQQKLPELAVNISFCGRGIPLVRSLCKEVTYHGSGNQVQAVYEWHDQTA